MRSKSLAAALALALAVGATACSAEASPDGTGSGTSEGSDPGGSTTTAGITDEDLPEEVRAAIEAPAGPVLRLTTDDAVLAPGDTVVVGGLADAVGPVELLGPDGPLASVPADGPSVSIPVPPGTPDGSYPIVAATADGRPGLVVVTVASGAHLGIEVDGRDLSVTAFGLPFDAVTVLEAGSGADLRYYEAVAGVLMPVGAEPGASLGDYTAAGVTLPPSIDGVVMLTVVLADGDVRSNRIDLGECAEPSIVTGTLGAPGEVRAVWAGANPGSAAASSSDGDYRLQAGPGLVAVTEVPFGGEPRTLLVQAVCGTEVEANEDGPATFGSFSTEGLADGEWVGAATGDLEAGVEAGIALCSVTEDGLDITLLDDYDLGLGVTAVLEDYIGSGGYTASGIVLDDAGGYSEGRFSFQIDRLEDGALEGSFAGSAAGPAGEIRAEGAFRCIPDGFSAADAPFSLFASYRETGGHDACHVGLVTIPEDAPAVGAAVARRLAAGLPLVEWNTTLDVSGLLSAAAYEQLAGIGTGSDALEAARRLVQADLYATVEILHLERFSEERRYWAVVRVFDTDAQALLAHFIAMGPDLPSLTALPGFEAVVAKVGAAGICGYVEPIESTLEAGDEQEVVLDVVDLLDRPVDGASVTISDHVDGRFSAACGTFEELEGSTSGGRFVGTFRAADPLIGDCTEHPRFKATVDGPFGELTTTPGRDPIDAEVHVASRWEFEATLRAQTPDGPLVWTFGTPDDPGSFFVREGGAIVGGAVGEFEGVRSCEVRENGALTFKEPLVELSGAWGTYLFGRFVDEEYFEFRFEGAGWSLDWPPLPDECAILEFAEGVYRIFAYRPDVAVVFPVRLSAEETTVTFAVDGEALPNAEFVVTIRPAPEEEGSG